MTLDPTEVLLWSLAGYGVFANVLAYMAFGIDKGRAERGEWRIPEVTLLLLALAGGWIGAKLAQRRFRHKTRKQPFAAVLNLIGAAQIGAVALLLAPAPLVLDGVERVGEMGVMAGGWVAQGLGAVVAEVFTTGTAFDGALDGAAPEEPEKLLPKRFGPGSDTGG